MPGGCHVLGASCKVLAASPSARGSLQHLAPSGTQHVAPTWHKALRTQHLLTADLITAIARGCPKATSLKPKQSGWYVIFAVYRTT